MMLLAPMYFSRPTLTLTFPGIGVAVCMRVLSRKHLYYAIATTAHNPPTVLAPDDSADALAAHDAVAGDFLGAGALLEGPEA